MLYNTRLIVLILISSFLLGGCNFFPDPVTLIQAPQQVKSADDVGKLIQKAKGFIPQGTSLAVPNEPVGMNSVLQADLNNDGISEAIVFYKSNLNADKVGAIVLQKDETDWKEIRNIKGTGYEISWGNVADLTGDGIPELLLGWKVGVSAGNVLDIYSWKQNRLEKLSQINYHELDLIRPENENNHPYQLAVWKRDLADVYEVDVLKWKGLTFSSEVELYPSYFLQVADYYQQRTTEAPDAPYYWYYLADSLVKAKKLEAALDAINKGLELNIVYPDRGEFEKLKEAIELELDKVSSLDVQPFLPAANLTMNIPRELYPNIFIEGSEGQSLEYLINVYITDQQRKGLLFAIEVHSKDFILNFEDTPLSLIQETDNLLYGVRRSSENPFIDEPKGTGYELFNQALMVVEDIIGSVRVGSAFPKHTSFEEILLMEKIQEAYGKHMYVRMGGEITSEVIETFQFDEREYRYLGEDLDTLEKLTNYLSSSFTKESIQSFIESDQLIEHKGKMAQPNADGGSLLSYKHARKVQVKDFGSEKQYDLKVPIGSSLTHEVIHIVFKKTADGWRISSSPSTF